MTRKLWRFIAISCAALAVVFFIFGFFIPAGTRVDFDISGFLWFITSLPRLMVWFCAILFAGLGIDAAVKMTRADYD